LVTNNIIDGLPFVKHYLSLNRIYLKGFSVNFPDNISADRNTLKTFVFSHKDEKLKPKGPVNVCRINKLYNLIGENGEEDNSIDEYFKITENEYSKYSLQLYKKYYEQKDIYSDPFADPNVKGYFTRFIFNLFKRVPKFYNKIKELSKDISDILNEAKAKDFYNRIMISTGETDTEEYKSIGYLIKTPRV
jgi:hypothetical protein